MRTEKNGPARKHHVPAHRNRGYKTVYPGVGVFIPIAGGRPVSAAFARLKNTRAGPVRNEWRIRLTLIAEAHNDVPSIALGRPSNPHGINAPATDDRRFRSNNFYCIDI